MKITRLESFSTQDVGFVRATCEDGSQGWGQFSPYNADITATVFHRQVARWAIGENAFDLLMEQLNGRDYVKRVTIATELIWRDSCRRPDGEA